MSVQKIKLADIAKPDQNHYVRLKLDRKRVDDFVNIASGQAPDQDKLKPKLITWPFPPIEITKVKPEAGTPLGTEAESGKTSKGKKTKVKKSLPYLLIDGHHRIAAAQILGMKEIEAEVKNITDPAEQFLAQYRANSTGPLQFSAVERAQAIWKMHNVFGIAQKDIVKETGLHKASISRIVAKKQGWGDYSKRKNTGKKKTATDNRGALYTPPMLFDHLIIHTGKDGYKKIKAAFLTYCAKEAPIKKLEELRDQISDLFDDIDKLFLKAQDANQTAAAQG